MSEPEPAPAPGRDAGLAAERTHLAWGRSTLSFLACGLAVGRGIPGVTDDGRPWLGAALAGLGGVVWVAASPWRSLPGRAQLRPRSGRHLVITSAGTTLVGVAAFAIASTSLP